MAYLPKPGVHAIKTEGESLTEPEHAKSCDINVIMKNVARGLHVRGGPQPQYGLDDTTMDGVSFRITKEQTETELRNLARENEFEEIDLNLIPKSVREKFGFKEKKKPTQTPPKNDDKPKNDEKPAASPASNTSPNPSPTN